MKKFIVLLLSLILLFNIVGCKSNDTTEDPSSESVTEPIIEVDPVPQYTEYTDYDTFIKDLTEKEAFRWFRIVAKAPILVPELKVTTYRFWMVRIYCSNYTYTFKFYYVPVSCVEGEEKNLSNDEIIEARISVSQEEYYEQLPEADGRYSVIIDNTFCDVNDNYCEKIYGGSRVVIKFPKDISVTKVGIIDDYFDFRIIPHKTGKYRTEI